MIGRAAALFAVLAGCAGATDTPDAPRPTGAVTRC